MRQALRAIEDHPGLAAPLQHDAGLPIQAQASAEGIELTVDAEQLRVWLDGAPRQLAARTVPGPFDSGRHWLTVQALDGGDPVAYRSFLFDVP